MDGWPLTEVLAFPSIPGGESPQDCLVWTAAGLAPRPCSMASRATDSDICAQSHGMDVETHNPNEQLTSRHQRLAGLTAGFPDTPADGHGPPPQKAATQR